MSFAPLNPSFSTSKIDLPDLVFPVITPKNRVQIKALLHAQKSLHEDAANAALDALIKHAVGAAVKIAVDVAIKETAATIGRESQEAMATVRRESQEVMQPPDRTIDAGTSPPVWCQLRTTLWPSTLIR